MESAAGVQVYGRPLKTFVQQLDIEIAAADLFRYFVLSIIRKALLYLKLRNYIFLEMCIMF